MDELLERRLYVRVIGAPKQASDTGSKPFDGGSPGERGPGSWTLVNPTTRVLLKSKFIRFLIRG